MSDSGGRGGAIDADTEGLRLSFGMHFREATPDNECNYAEKAVGYLPENSSPRKATLNLLSQFVGYADWEDFCRREGFTAGGDDAVDDGEPTVSRGVRRFRPFAIAAVAAVLVMLFVGGFLMKQHLSAATTAGSYVLRKGQVFSTCDDYLRLFGIYDSTNWWGRVLPHHPDIVVWGPEYHHPHWLNEGNRQQLMPTITERWSSETADSSWIVMRNADKYRHDLRQNEVRITFMKNLTDTGFVFLGVYRLSLNQSDTTRCVWERVAEDCDLANLDYLEELRN